MAYLTENFLTGVLDIPIALPATELRQGDWLVIATTKLVTPMTLSFRHINLSLMASSVELATINNSNRIFGNLGLLYVALRHNYNGESPGSAGALDVLGITALGTYTRSNALVQLTEEGTYSWIIANNMKASNDSDVPVSTSIDFRVAVTGSARLALE